MDATVVQNAMHGYVKEAIGASVLAAGGFMLKFPVKTFFNGVKDKWDAQVKVLSEIQEELAEQRTNHLSHIEVSSDAQVKLLEKAVTTLEAMHLDQRTLLGRLDK